MSNRGDDESGLDALTTGGTGGTDGMGTGTETGAQGGTFNESTLVDEAGRPADYGATTPEAGRPKEYGSGTPEAGDTTAGSAGKESGTGSATGYGTSTPETGRPTGDGMGLTGQRIQELRASGLDPSEQLFVSHPTPPDTGEQIRDFYAPSAPSWLERVGPRG